ncbi:MAG: GH92 family glycosyl hydrolase [Holophagaceae bacterium]|nr:GH92 family glycosyl hydrolase [Holophagaceae bacterium]
MKKTFCFALLMCCLTLSAQSLADMVDPLGGTASSYEFSHGNVYPATAVPFGMHAWTPQTGRNGDGWTYRYDAIKIRGIKLTHQPSPWINDYGSISLMPVGHELKVRENDRAAFFSHEREEARAYSYKVKLLETGILAEVAPTSRAAMMRFTIPEGQPSHIVLDAFPKGRDAELVQVSVDKDKSKITGISRHHHGGVPKGFGLYFVITFDQPLLDAGTWNEREGVKRSTSIEGDQAGAWVKVNGGIVHASIGASFISLEQAERNLSTEIGSNNFDSIKARAKAEWEKTLGRVVVEGGTKEQQSIFYTCLYRASLFPRTFHEINAEGRTVHYSPYNGKVVDGVMYTDNGFWDTFRSAFPLLTLLQPTLNGQMMQGFVNAYSESGWIPEWQSPGHRNCMIGTNSASILTDAWIKGIRGWDIEKGWEGLMKAAHNPGPVSSVGRLGAEHYDKLGYVPSNVGINESAARSLEYAYNDFCLWQLAKVLGKPAEVQEKYRDRALNYRHLFDDSIGFMRGKKSDGSWQTPFRPDSWGGVFTEGCSWHWTWCVFHDSAGLSRLFGGDKPMSEKLDAVFTALPTFESSYYGSVIHEIAEMVVADMGQYAHGNQPIQHMIYMYNHVGQPWKAQAWLREVMDRMYKPGPELYCGDEDNGQTSAWYVFSAMGMYSVTPGVPQYALGSPLFNRITLNLENGKTFTIEAPNNSPKNIYVQSATLNGKPLSRTWIGHEEILAGGTLKYVMSDVPNLQRGTNISDRPYSMETWENR